MADLSIIIVSYQCRTVLSICLGALEVATRGLEVETIVVDNASSDGTRELVVKSFPKVRLIKNDLNLGFSKANNQGIKAAESKRILILNPDTVVFKSSLLSCIDLLKKNQDCGALGIRMLDARGGFLPESKRGIPTPWRSFTKLSGVWRLSPGSSFLSGYYSGNVMEDKNGKVEILSGAFLMLDKQRVGEALLFDEDFFMFGEDIDLSYRILKKGLKNFYLGNDFIIHFKGESSIKNSPEYRKNFYGAMELFRQKHFGRSGLSGLQKFGIGLFQSLGQKSKPFSVNPDDLLPTVVGKSSQMKAQAEMLFSGRDGKGRKVLVLDPRSDTLQEVFKSGKIKEYDLAAFWSEFSSEFFLSPGKDSKGLVLSAT